MKKAVITLMAVLVLVGGVSWAALASESPKPPSETSEQQTAGVQAVLGGEMDKAPAALPLAGGGTVSKERLKELIGADEVNLEGLAVGATLHRRVIGPTVYGTLDAIGYRECIVTAGRDGKELTCGPEILAENARRFP